MVLIPHISQKLGIKLEKLKKKIKNSHQSGERLVERCDVFGGLLWADGLLSEERYKDEACLPLSMLRLCAAGHLLSQHSGGEKRVPCACRPDSLTLGSPRWQERDLTP